LGSSRLSTAEKDAISIIYPTEGERVIGGNVELVGWVRGAPRGAGHARMAFRINGRLHSSLSVLPQARSPFKQQLPLEEGMNEILLELMVGLVDQKKVTVDALPDKEAISYESLYKSSWALLIGIDNSPAAQPLKYAVKDAKSLEDFLRTRTCFEEDRIFTLHNEQATKTRILELMNDFLGANPALTSDDRVLVFFAGHGQRRRVQRGKRKSDYRGYLVPYDGNLQKIHSTCISMEEIKEAASVICAKHTLFILDCCFSGLAGLRPRAAIAPRPKLKALSDPCVRIIAAGKSDEEVFEGKESWGGNSLFSRYLLKGLEGFADHDNDGIITSDELYFFVRDRVVEESCNRQTPQARHFVEYGEGQFVFFVRDDEQSNGTKDVPEVEPAGEHADTTESREPIQTAPAKAAVISPDTITVPGGKFRMGSSDAADESPIHTVKLSAFKIDLSPVTNRMYGEFLQATGYDGRAEADDNYLADWASGSYPPGQEGYPVTCISWFNAAAYCLWRGCQLPTEAQWEMACRGGLSGKRFPWGDALPDELVNRPNAGRRKMLVGRAPPNGFGLLDICGAVSQWCRDFYDRDYYSTSPSLNPGGPQSGKLRVVRGGSFLAGPRLLRCAARFAADPKTTSRTIGFRCAKCEDDHLQ